MFFEMIYVEDSIVGLILNGLSRVLDIFSGTEWFSDLHQEILEGIGKERLHQYVYCSDCEVASNARYLIERYYPE